jgi:DNA-binding MarR family transcriptional regulator
MPSPGLAKILAKPGLAVYPLRMVKPDPDAPYVLDEQIGYVLRRVTQRHLAIFSDRIPEVTTTQFAVLARLSQLGPLSQNRLGRETAMDGATIKGVVDRLVRLGLVSTSPDPEDRRRLTVAPTTAGAALFAARKATALAISDETLGPLGPEERRLLQGLLMRLT